MFEKRKLVSTDWALLCPRMAIRSTKPRTGHHYFVTRNSAYRQPKIALPARPRDKSVVLRTLTAHWDLNLVPYLRLVRPSGNARAPRRCLEDWHRDCLARHRQSSLQVGSRLKSWIACVCRARPRLRAPPVAGPKNDESGRARRRLPVAALPRSHRCDAYPRAEPR